jgi:hypothetical protein
MTVAAREWAEGQVLLTTIMEVRLFIIQWDNMSNSF